MIWPALKAKVLSAVRWRKRDEPSCRRPWPARILGAHIVVDIDNATDVTLQGRAITGRVRACGTDIMGKSADMLIQLDEPLAYQGRCSETKLRWVVVSPCMRCELIDRLFIASAAVRVVDALSIGDVRYERTIAIGRARFADGTLFR